MSNEELTRVFNRIEESRAEMILFLGDIIREPAIGPESGGDGEMGKAAVIERHLLDYGFGNITRFDAPDDQVSSGTRPNIRAVLKGKSSGSRIVMITHMDVVSPGAIDEWKTHPHEIDVKDGKISGRGVEDNGQSITATIFAAKALMDMDIRPSRDVVLIFVSDEEETNEKGIRFILEKGLMKKGDLIVVPDHGEPEGRLIDISEKSILWVKVTVKGRQSHASLPGLGRNAFRASMRFGTMVDGILHQKFDVKDASFDHPTSSFEPTKRESAQSGINVLPGEDVFYFDCRLLPVYSPEEVLDELNRVARLVEKETGTSISIEPVLVERTEHPTPADAPVVKMLSDAIYRTCDRTTVKGGIGGGTCAAILRNAGFEVAVWETIENTAHSPNEYIKVENLVNDCKVFAALFLEKDSA